MVGPRVGIEASSWSGQFAEQPGLDEQPEVPVDGAQAHPWRSANDQSVDFLGSGVRLDPSDTSSTAWRGAVSRNPRSRSATSALSTPGGRASCAALPTRISGMILISNNVPERTSRYERSLSVSRRDATPVGFGELLHLDGTRPYQRCSSFGLRVLVAPANCTLTDSQPPECVGENVAGLIHRFESRWGIGPVLSLSACASRNVVGWIASHADPT